MLSLDDFLEGCCGEISMCPRYITTPLHRFASHFKTPTPEPNLRHSLAMASSRRLPYTLARHFRRPHFARPPRPCPPSTIFLTRCRCRRGRRQPRSSCGRRSPNPAAGRETRTGTAPTARTVHALPAVCVPVGPGLHLAVTCCGCDVRCRYVPDELGCGGFNFHLLRLVLCSCGLGVVRHGRRGHCGR